MIKLKNTMIQRYKCIENPQKFDVESDITILVGMNESGKTSILEALAKCNYFEDDESFKLNQTHDYPRKQLKTLSKSGDDPVAVVLEYVINDELAKAIQADIGVPMSSRIFSVTKKYGGGTNWSVNGVTTVQFVAEKFKTLKIKDKALADNLSKVDSITAFEAFIQTMSEDDSATTIEAIKPLRKYFENKNNWHSGTINEYIMRHHLSPNLPKFMYYDDYYMLPSRVSLNNIETVEYSDPSTKTAKALLELADIDMAKLMTADNFEDFIAELEATQAIISDELFKYWTTNKNLEILFQIDKRETTDARGNTNIVERILDIRVKNRRSGVSLPLGNRSKGFNWFFSFLVWFKRIQDTKNRTYILLLDEPGLNLHAKAQNDLLKFLTDLSAEYQIIYTTHSPFMIETNKLNHVRTVVEKDDGTHISESVQEKDPNTLFPLQAALGYDLAQNLFVARKNLIVEGIADLVYLNLISGILLASGKTGLKNDITIVPVGGADKVATFVSLLRGNELDMVCLLDTFADRSAKNRLENLVAQNLIKNKKIVFYHDILGRTNADVEDLFTRNDYLSLYNASIGKNYDIDDFNSNQTILMQIKKKNGNKDFNHYTPANYLAKNIATIALSDETLVNFEKLFVKINKLI
jgi:predicted ATPase